MELKLKQQSTLKGNIIRWIAYLGKTKEDLLFFIEDDFFRRNWHFIHTKRTD